MVFSSHPGKLLVEHLTEVRDLNINKIPDNLKKPYEIVGLCHDFGKYTIYFQDYLKKGKKSDLSNHGFISAIFGAFTAFNILGEESILPLVIYNVILHHHGNLESFTENLPSKTRNVKITDYPLNLLDKMEIGKKQLNNIKNNFADIKKDFEAIGLINELEEFLSEENIIETTLQKLKISERKLSLMDKNVEYYFVHQTLYSALISADKLSAAGIMYDKPLFSTSDYLEKIKKEKFKNDQQKINIIREDIFRSVLNNLERNYNKSRIFSITAPTGTGKTYTGFFAALKLKELLGLDGKIIYSLPFTSIIDQNYSVLVEVLEKIDSFKDNSSRFIIKHHNMSKTDYQSEYFDYDKSQSELLIENWESGIVVTTFVQLFETIIGHRNRMLKKFISFYNSVILIDEIQSIDIKYYNLIEYALKKLCEYTNCRIIIMTATKPLILQDSIELLPENERYFKMFNRTYLVPKLKSTTLEEFAQSFAEELKDKSYLIVCNTINQSIKIYELLKSLNRDIYYLSTNILPFVRRARIDEIKERLKNEDKIILVSTQVVEAGVDMDFDEVIRDLAPFDSIIQCAGRCNRSGTKPQGKVSVVNLVKESGDSYGKDVYGNTLLNLSRTLLKDKDLIEEPGYFDLINDYYYLVKENKSQKESDEFIKSICSLNFSTEQWPINKFSLIKDNPNYADVLFLYDEIAESAFKEYKKIIKIKDFNEKRSRYLEIGQILKNYILSIPVKYCRNFVQDCGLLVLPREGIEQFYNDETGFIRDDKETYMIF